MRSGCHLAGLLAFFFSIVATPAQRATCDASVAAQAGPSGIEFVCIPAGEFMMGSDSSQAELDEKPVHRVRIGKAFQLSRFEITRAEWWAVMWSAPPWWEPGQDKRPADSVSWEDVQLFLARLNELDDGYTYRLPTEAEWEYACRAGTTTEYHWGNTMDGEYAWCSDNSGGRTHDVGQKKPNVWGLHDMSGNAWEWCQDWYSGSYYSSSPFDDPSGPGAGTRRVIRGGSGYFNAEWARSAYRDCLLPSDRADGVGFRLVRSIATGTLQWNTFLGGNGYEEFDEGGYSIVLDGAGNIYVTGSSNASWGAPINPHSGEYDAFVAKLDSAGTLQWHTFLGGTSRDKGNGIALDSSGNIYVIGESYVSWGTPVRAHTGAYDAFVTKLDSSGVFQWHTFLGGNDRDFGNGIALDSAGDIYVTGESYTSWETPLRAHAGAHDGFVAKLNSLGTLQWNTFLGSSGGDDSGEGIAVDSGGDVCVTGESDASWGTPIHAHAGGGARDSDAFVAKFDSSGTLQWHSFLGGRYFDDGGRGITLDSAGDIYVTGHSDLSWGSPVRPHAGAFDAFVAKLDSSGTLEWHSFLGGTLGTDEGSGIALDIAGDIYVIGSSRSRSWGTPIHAFAGYDDAFVAKLYSSGVLQWNSFLGGSWYDEGYGIALDGTGNLYVTGRSNLTWGRPISPHTGSLWDTFVARISGDLVCPQPPTAGFSWIPASPTIGQTVLFSDTSTGPPTSWYWEFGDGKTSTLQNPATSYSGAGAMSVKLTVSNAAGSNTKSSVITVRTTSAAELSTSVVDFGSCAVGAGVTKEFFILNTGEDPLIVQDIAGGAPHFRVVDSTGSTVQPAGSRTVAVRFSPQASGRCTATLTIHSNDPWSPTQSLTLTGIGQAGDSNDPLADFVWSPNEPVPGQSVSFTQRSNKSGSWNWSFGDGAISSVPNPSHLFERAGSYPVTLTVRSAYGEDTATKTLTVKAQPGVGPYVKSPAHRELVGFFVGSSGSTNRFDVDVDWKGRSPGRIEFFVNGKSLGQVAGNNRGGFRTFQLDSEFTPSWTPSAIGIQAIGSDDVRGQTVNEQLYVFPQPIWLGLVHPKGGVQFEKSGGELRTTVLLSFPDPPFRGSIFIPDAIPLIGGDLGFVGDNYATLSGAYSSTGRGSASLFGQIGFQAAGQKIAGRFGGECSFVLGPPNGLQLTDGTFSLHLSGTVKKEVGILEAFPQLAPVARMLPTINNTVKLVGLVSPNIDAITHFDQRSDGRLGFTESTFVVGNRLEGRLKVSVGLLTGYGYAAGEETLTVGVPAPYLRELRAAIEVGADFHVDFFLVKAGWDGKIRYGCTWTNGGGVRCEREDGSAHSALSLNTLTGGSTAVLEPIVPDYARYGQYSSFRPTERARNASPRTPVDVRLLTLATNIYEGAAPQLAKVGNGRMLVWTHQDLNDEGVNSGEVAYSWDSGTNWTPMALIANDTRPERQPVVAADGQGRAVVAWIRYRDAHVSPVPATLDDLGAYLKRFDVVTATYDPVSATWSAIRELTSDSSADLDPHLTSAGTRVLLTWLQNPDGAMVSTTESPSRLMHAFWDGSQWSAPAAVASNLVGVAGHVSAMRDGQAFIIVPVDPDPDVSGDERLYRYAWSGNGWSAAEVFASGGGDHSPAVAYDQAGVGHVVWLRSGSLVHATLADPTPETIREASGSMGFLNTRLMAGPSGTLTVIWQQETEEGPANIYALIYDSQKGTWSVDRRLNEEDALAYSISGYHGDDGTIRLSYMLQQTEESSETFEAGGESFTIDGVPTPGRADLELLEHSLIVDLATADEDLSVTPSRPVPGTACVATLRMHNAGDFAVGPFAVRLYAGPSTAAGTLLDTKTVDLLNGGAQTTLTFECDYPETGGDLIAVVDAQEQVAEFSETNNQAVSYLTNRPPVPALQASATGGAAPLTIAFDASQTLDLDQDAVAFRWTFADGDIDATDARVSRTFTQPGKYLVTLVVTDSRGGRATSSVTITVEPTRHYFPFARWMGGSFTGYGVANHSISDATVQFDLFRPDSAQDKSDPVLIPVGRQQARLGAELFPQAGQVSQGWVEMPISQPGLESLFQFGTGRGLDGGLSWQRWSKTLYWSRVFDGSQAFRGYPAVTTLSLANPSSESVRVRLRLFARPADSQNAAVAAVQVAQAERTLVSKGSVYEAVAELFPNVGQISDGFVVGDVLEGPGLVGFELIDVAGEGTVIGLAAFPSAGDSAVSYSAQLAELGGAIYSNVRLLNLTAQEVTVTLTAIGDDGGPLTPEPTTVVLPAWGLLQSDAGPLFGFAPDQLKVGTLCVEATTPGVIGDVVFGAPNGSNSAAIALQPITFRKARFNHVGNLPGILFTGLALYNPGTRNSNVQVAVYSSGGTLVGQESVTVQAGARISKLVDELVPSSSGQAGGYVVLESDSGIIGQMLFGAYDLSYMSAVPPTVVE